MGKKKSPKNSGSGRKVQPPPQRQSQREKQQTQFFQAGEGDKKPPIKPDPASTAANKPSPELTPNDPGGTKLEGKGVSTPTTASQGAAKNGEECTPPIPGIPQNQAHTPVSEDNKDRVEQGDGLGAENGKNQKFQNGIGYC